MKKIGTIFVLFAFLFSNTAFSFQDSVYTVGSLRAVSLSERKEKELLFIENAITALRSNNTESRKQAVQQLRAFSPELRKLIDAHLEVLSPRARSKFRFQEWQILQIDAVASQIAFINSIHADQTIRDILRERASERISYDFAIDSIAKRLCVIDTTRERDKALQEAAALLAQLRKTNAIQLTLPKQSPGQKLEDLLRRLYQARGLDRDIRLEALRKNYSAWQAELNRVVRESVLNQDRLLQDKLEQVMPNPDSDRKLKAVIARKSQDSDVVSKYYTDIITATSLALGRIQQIIKDLLSNSEIQAIITNAPAEQEEQATTIDKLVAQLRYMNETLTSKIASQMAEELLSQAHQPHVMYIKPAENTLGAVVENTIQALLVPPYNRLKDLDDAIDYDLKNHPWAFEQLLAEGAPVQAAKFIIERLAVPEVARDIKSESLDALLDIAETNPAIEKMAKAVRAMKNNIAEYKSISVPGLVEPCPLNEDYNRIAGLMNTDKSETANRTQPTRTAVVEMHSNCRQHFRCNKGKLVVLIVREAGDKRYIQAYVLEPGEIITVEPTVWHIAVNGTDNCEFQIFNENLNRPGERINPLIEFQCIGDVFDAKTTDRAPEPVRHPRRSLTITGLGEV